MTTPNLFKFATFELSQEAFLCWLLSWASPEYKNGSDTHKLLNETATDLIKFFFKKANKELLEPINEIKVESQVGNKKNRLDVVCIVNDTYCLLIEHKVGTIQGKNQLTNYLNYIVNDKGKSRFTLDNIIPIYLQTHDQSNYKKVLEDGFFPVQRHELISILGKNYKVMANYSDIYADFHDYLQEIETAVQSFKTLPVNQWRYRAWIGFFQYLQLEFGAQFGAGNWGYVANPAGGFMGYWGMGQKVADKGVNSVYLQFEEDKICFKMSVTDKAKRSSVRNQFNRLFVTEAPKYNLTVKKPKSYGSGRHMTFAVLTTDVISQDNPDPIDLAEVNKLIVTLQEFIEHCANLYKEQNA